MEITSRPGVTVPNIIAAFQGWNDAGQSATTAVRYLIESWKAKSFAKIDAEQYYSFSDTRPTIKIVAGSQRELTWPSMEFFFAEGSEQTPPAVLVVGPEPNLKWRSFCTEVLDLAASLGTTRLVTLGSLVTDAVHTRPVPITGFATDPAMQEKLAGRNITRSNYEGPTGIVGVLHSYCIEAAMPTASLWAAAPYYLGSTPNPKTALGLLETVDDAMALNLNLGELNNVADEFVRQVSLAVRDNAEVQEQIRMLEQRYDDRPVNEPATPPEFPPTGAIIADLESFLRDQRTDEG